MYIRKYTRFKEYIKIGEYEIPLPDPPNDNLIDGYRLSVANQKFYYTRIPKNLISLPYKDRLEFISKEYNRRKNGYWIFLKGERFYIPPYHYFFLNYWLTQEGRRPVFKVPNRDIFLFIDYTHREDKCLGSFVIKPRGIGWTDIVDSVLLERATRIRNSRHAMFHINMSDNLKSFNRIVAAYNSLPFYMKPMKSGSNLDKDGEMVFERPPEILTKKKLSVIERTGELQEDDIQGLNSRIITYATTHVSGDSERFKTIFVDEFGKMGLKNTTRIDLLSKHDVLKYTLFIENGKKQIGKIHYGSTVEDETDEGIMIEQIREMWNNSDPNRRLPDGYTISGLYRLLIPASWGEPVDEYGMVDEKKYHAERILKEKALMGEGKISELIRFRRKQCMNIHDALAMPSTQCVVDREKVEAQLFRVLNPYDENGNLICHQGVKGNFLWKDGVKYSSVVWQPDPNGRFLMLRNEEKNNNYRYENGYRIPGNRLMYGAGIDPYENQISRFTARHSKGALVIKRRFDPLIDSHEKPLSQWTTNQIVLTYNYRCANPKEFFDDMLKACVYYGTDVLIEKAKGTAIRKYFEEAGFAAYIQWASPEFAANADLKEPMLTANQETIYKYVDLIRMEVSEYCELIYDPELLEQLRTFTNDKKNRSERDLVVAFGIALVAEHKNFNADIPSDTEEEGIFEYKLY